MAKNLPGMPLHQDRALLAELLQGDTLHLDSIVVQALAERIANQAASSETPRQLLHALEQTAFHLAAAIATLRPEAAACPSQVTYAPQGRAAWHVHPETTAGTLATGSTRVLRGGA